MQPVLRDQELEAPLDEAALDEAPLDEAAAIAPAAALFHALSEPTRLLILQHLFSGEHRVRELTEHLGLAQSTVSAHLACLRDCGLVRSRAEGRASMFSLVDPDRLVALFAVTEGLLAATGSAVTLCTHLTQQNQTEQDRTEQDQTEQNRAEQDRTEQERSA
ncbi:ArsR/SmtB family transcription factor [Promicromonospora sukumoe]|uniref:ArsR/SmtB family transcription factor n=1 Tax=Promicromonospora sukumoe TaxID=88382 RepID=UPI0037C73385